MPACCPDTPRSSFTNFDEPSPVRRSVPDLPCSVRPKDGNPDPVLTSTQEAGVGVFRSCLHWKTEARPRSPPVNLRGNVELPPDGTGGAFNLKALRKGDC